MAHQRLVIRDPFGGSTGRPDPPDVHPIRHHALDKVDERLIRGPDEEVAVQAWRGREDFARFGRLAGIAHVHGITWPRRVVDQAGGVAGPVEFGGASEIGSWLPAEHRHRPDTYRRLI